MKFKGVNLGGWLILEKWITPSVFDGLEAQDETSFCLELGNLASERLLKHWKSFIAERDFKWIKGQGLNSVRVPVGHWIFGDVPPYFSSIEVLDLAFKWAEKYQLGVVIDLHAVPGSQNGWDHSGIKGQIEWTMGENMATSLEVIENLSKRYAKSESLVGIELVNEPNEDISQVLLEDYYMKGYEIVRKYCRDEVAVIISDAYRPFDWEGFMQGPRYMNVILDTHMYQCFKEEDKNMDVQEHLNKTKSNWREQLDKMQESLPVIVGEWSLALDKKAFAGLSEEDINDAYKGYGQAQIQTFEKTAGWFYWTYKTEKGGVWSFKENILLLAQKGGDNSWD